jgi:integrase
MKELKEGKQKNGEPYAEATIKHYVQTILWAFDHLPDMPKIPPDVKQKYDLVFNVKKAESAERAEIRKNTEIAPEWKPLLDGVLKNFGRVSQMNLLTNMYYDTTVRDDFHLKIIKRADEATDATINYLVLPRQGDRKCTAILNVYKTQKKYGTNKFDFNETVSELLREYIEKEKINDGEYLFKQKKLSTFFSTNLKKVGIMDITLRTLRVMTRTAAQDKPTEEQVVLARRMGHSIATAKAVYTRKAATPTPEPPQPVVEPVAAAPKKGRKKKN